MNEDQLARVRVKQALSMDKDFAAGMEYAERLRRQRSEDVFMQGIVEIARGDKTGIFDDEGKILPVNRWPKTAVDLLKGITFNDDGGIKNVNFWSRDAALRTLGKTLGLLEVKREDRHVMTLLSKKLEAIEG